MMYQRILVPMDDSLSARRALHEASRLVVDQHATLKIIHMIDMAHVGWGGTEFIDTEAWQTSVKEAGQQLLTQAETYLNTKNITAEFELIEGYGLSVGDEILKASEAWSADLLVMGTHGWTGLMHLLMGSVAEAVLHKTKIPLLLVRSNASEEDDSLESPVPQ
jgi:nucleotide-binding universal stress UspA family protein